MLLDSIRLRSIQCATNPAQCVWRVNDIYERRFMPNVGPSSRCSPTVALAPLPSIPGVVRPVSDHGPTSHNEVPRPYGIRRRALIVEDEPAVANVAKKGLERAAFTVEVARTGADGTLRIFQGGFDIVVLDWRLGDMTGGEVLRIVRGAGLSTPVIVLSGYD